MATVKEIKPFTSFAEMARAEAGFDANQEEREETLRARSHALLAALPRNADGQFNKQAETFKRAREEFGTAYADRRAPNYDQRLARKGNTYFSADCAPEGAEPYTLKGTAARALVADTAAKKAASPTLLAFAVQIKESIDNVKNVAWHRVQARFYKHAAAEAARAKHLAECKKALDAGKELPAPIAADTRGIRTMQQALDDAGIRIESKRAKQNQTTVCSKEVALAAWIVFTDTIMLRTTAKK